MITTRDDMLLAMRPTVQTDETTDTLPAEQFQNQTLRPILKLQNELLLDTFRDYCHKRKDTYTRLPHTEKLAWIEQALQTDQKFRNRLVGYIVGHFTSNEWQMFRASEPELVRRTVSMLIQRLQYQAKDL